MPIYIVVTNNSDKPISLDQARIDLISATGDKIPAARSGRRGAPHDACGRNAGKVIPLLLPLPPIKKEAEDAGQENRTGFF